MSLDIRTQRRAIALAAILALLAPGTGGAEIVDASSTTMLTIREQARAGTLYTLAPIYELLSVSARDVANPVAEDLQLVFSGWGAASAGPNKVWYDATPPQHVAFGDVDLAYLQGELAGRSVRLRLGRQLVLGGVTGALQLDGGHVLLRLPYGFGADAYAGSPVSQRFDERGTEFSFNPKRGNFATGGRLSFTLPAWGEVGASVVEVRDGGAPSQRQVGGDLRLTPARRLFVFGSSGYDLYESRWAEASVLAQYQVLPRLFVSADGRHVEPDLLLSRASILSVFANDRRNEVGAGADWAWRKGITVGGDYHLVRQAGDDAGRDGHRVGAHATWRPRVDTSLGIDAAALRAPVNGYYHVRAYGSRQVDRFTGTLDVQEVAFLDPVNGQKSSFLAGATVGYAIGYGFSALVNGTGGATPQYERRFDVMAKLAYNQSYRLREVR